MSEAVYSPVGPMGQATNGELDSLVELRALLDVVLKQRPLSGNEFGKVHSLLEDASSWTARLLAQQGAAFKLCPICHRRSYVGAWGAEG